MNISDHICIKFPKEKEQIFLNSQKCQKLILKKSQKSTGPRSSMSPKHNKHKKIIARHIIINLLKTNDKEKILKTSIEKGHITDREIKIREP